MIDLILEHRELTKLKSPVYAVRAAGERMAINEA